MTDCDLNEIIINLNVLAELEKNKKLLTKQQYLNIDNSNYKFFQSITRWFNGESRDETIKRLDNLIQLGIKNIENKKEIKEYLLKSIKGLTNLQNTYCDCPQSQARLKVIIDKINALDKND